MVGFVFLFCLLFRWGILNRVWLVVGGCQVLHSSGFFHVNSHYLILPRVISLAVYGLGVSAPIPKAQGLISEGAFVLFLFLFDSLPFSVRPSVTRGPLALPNCRGLLLLTGSKGNWFKPPQFLFSKNWSQIKSHSSSQLPRCYFLQSRGKSGGTTASRQAVPLQHPMPGDGLLNSPPGTVSLGLAPRPRLESHSPCLFVCFPNYICLLFYFIFFNLKKFYFYFILLYNTVLVLPYIDMNPSWVYMRSQTRTPLPPPSP